MKKIIAIIIAVMTMCGIMNSAVADEIDVALYVYNKVPGATVDDAKECARVWAHGGTYVSKIRNIKLECAKHLITETWDHDSEE